MSTNYDQVAIKEDQPMPKAEPVEPVEKEYPTGTAYDLDAGIIHYH